MLKLPSTPVFILLPKFHPPKKKNSRKNKKKLKRSDFNFQKWGEKIARFLYILGFQCVTLSREGSFKNLYFISGL
jgi:hypothetical protein